MITKKSRKKKQSILKQLFYLLNDIKCLHFTTVTTNIFFLTTNSQSPIPSNTP